MQLAVRSALLLLHAGMAAAVHAQGSLPLAELGINAKRIKVEIAHTPAARQTGLMHRTALPEHQGMLFAYPDSETRCMWMKNTLIPLSVAFIDARGRILNIEDMQPKTRDYHCSTGSVQFSLEMNLGWFRTNGAQAGDKVQGLESLPGQNSN